MHRPRTSTSAKRRMSMTHPEGTERTTLRERLRISLGITALVLSASACGDPVDMPIACTEQFVYGISIQIVDVNSGAQRASGSTVTIRDGAYEEVVTQVIGNNTMVAAGERAGTYSVTVTRDGYEEWSRFDVEVDEDECHVIPVSLLAQLQPTA